MLMMEKSPPHPAAGVRASRTAPVVVAIDGTEGSDAAVRLARLFAPDDALRAITVVRPLPMSSPEPMLSVSPEVEISRQNEQRSAAVEQLARVAPKHRAEIEIGHGDPALTIARVARDGNATMIVAGLGRHRVIDRMFGDETALALVRVASVPVLAVSRTMTAAPRCIVVGVDFSETSRRAARLAVELAAPEASIYLVHVAPRDAALYGWSSWGSGYKADAGASLRVLRDELRAPESIAVQKVILQGDPATELLAFAASLDADLIATGSHGFGFVTRLLVGSVATRILRQSTCSVLCVPHAAAMTDRRVTGTPATVVAVERGDWTAELEAFTQRNIGRRASLEIDDPDFGAQAQEHDYPLLGAAYDPHDDRVELMFGRVGDRRHLSRGIADADTVEIMTDERGRDLALRVTHGEGQSLLTFAE